MALGIGAELRAGGSRRAQFRGCCWGAVRGDKVAVGFSGLGVRRWQWVLAYLGGPRLDGSDVGRVNEGFGPAS